jgi:hypothetical protein
VVCFFEFLTPFILGAVIFSFHLFSTIVSVLDARIEGVHILFGHQKERNPPLDPTYHERLSV